MKDKILITIDVEDWFQVENFKPWIPFSTWETQELRVEKNTHKLLDLLDSFNSDGAHAVSASKDGRKKAGVHVNATFFFLGWLAEKLPALVREIHARGHEIASHGFNHQLCQEMDRPAFSRDLKESRQLLEDIIGAEVTGYRAPSFSVDNEILKVVEESGYRYDSSYNSFDKHGRYGKVLIDGYEKHGLAYRLGESFHELPISNLRLNAGMTVLPWGGGGYFRLFPWFVFRYGIERMLRKDNGYVFYLHPWEIDENQPRVEAAPKSINMRHSLNIDKTYRKLRKMISRFSHCEFISCGKYIQSLEETSSIPARSLGPSDGI